MRGLPKVHRLLECDAGEKLQRTYSRPRIAKALREVLELERRRILLEAGPSASAETLLARTKDRLERPEGVRGVINAAGVVLHTNLGRAPLAEAALAAVREVGGYCDLEYDLRSGRRGDRMAGVEPVLTSLFEAEAGLVVNNAAAGLLLALSALAAGGDVLVSRGELVEIGGGFRIPEVIAQGGARLIEVGTTNKTRLSDYSAAITDAVRVILKVHPSNYRITGFTEEAPIGALAGLARAHGLCLVHDVGAGALVNLARFGLGSEPHPKASVAAGADLVVFSGDKLLGGPQAGIVVGRADVVGRLRRHPLNRALRPDKMTLAALEASLRLYEDPEEAITKIPVLRMLSQSEAEVLARAERVKAALGRFGAACRIEGSRARVGGGACPGAELASACLVLPGGEGETQALAARLRAGAPPVIARIGGGEARLDLFAVADEEVLALAEAVVAATGAEG